MAFSVVLNAPNAPHSIKSDPLRFRPAEHALLAPHDELETEGKDALPLLPETPSAGRLPVLSALQVCIAVKQQILNLRGTSS